MEGFSLNSLLLKICDQLDVKQYALPGKSTTQTLVYLDPCFIHLILRDRSLFMAGGGTEEKCFLWQKFC